MLPNWLYGKSKSKLASILGGGGAPADYNQVKAQVNQNTEDIALLDTSSQALTSQANDMVNVLGVKNLLSNNVKSQTIDGVTCTVNSDGSINTNGVYTGSDGVLLRINMSFTVSQSGEYVLTGTPFTQEEWTFLLYIVDDSASSIIAIDLGQGVNCSLDSSKAYSVVLWCKPNFDTSGYNIKPMVRLASIEDDTYVPYAMTNQELTDKLTSDANLDTAVDLSTYTAYSNMFTAPSDGYVHFQSAASGSATRTIYAYGNNTTAAVDPHFIHSTSANNEAFEIYIKKGLKIYVDGLSSGDTINFYPLI